MLFKEQESIEQRLVAALFPGWLQHDYLALSNRSYHFNISDTTLKLPSVLFVIIPSDLQSTGCVRKINSYKSCSTQASRGEGNLLRSEHRLTLTCQFRVQKEEWPIILQQQSPSTLATRQKETERTAVDFHYRLSLFVRKTGRKESVLRLDREFQVEVMGLNYFSASNKPEIKY